MRYFSFCRDKSAAEKRRQLIQESKFLGGDMEHTHLVKGLDFALLQKVCPVGCGNALVQNVLVQPVGRGRRLLVVHTMDSKKC